MSSPSVDKLFFHILPFIIPIILLTIFLYKWLIVVVFQTKHNLPPSPPRLPIIGNLHQLGKFPHRSLRSLSQKYGDYMLLYLGNKPTLVVSSATAAEQIMRTHDLIFANRPESMVVNKVAYGGKDVIFNSYGEKWRKMKSICVTKLLNNKRVQSFKPIREEEVGLLIEEIKSYNGSVINLSETLFILFKGLISRTALGRKYNHHHGDDGFPKLFKEVLEILGVGSVGDYVPFLSWIDKLSGLESRAEVLGKKLDEFIEYVVEQHLNVINDNNIKEDDDEVKDLVDVMLEIQRENPQELTTQNIKAIILDMFIAGTESSSTTLDWAMTELIKNPNIMEKAQQEIRSIVKGNARVTEDDLQKMEYLKAITKETLRLHLPGPLLTFRESNKNVKIDKYDICERTQVIINAWAIHLDPKSWQDPEAFIPERFLNNSSSIDFKGQQFQYIPFGAGRRGCPGITYGIVNAEIVLANLLYEFNWKLPYGRQGHTLDTDECPGIVVGRRNPLMVIATPNM